MKKNIHPKFYPKAKITCVCGNIFEIGSTREFMKTEVCSKCHPFYTKQDRKLDKVNRVRKFKEKWNQKK